MNSKGEGGRLSTSHLYSTSEILFSKDAEGLGRPPPAEPFKCKKLRRVEWTLKAFSIFQASIGRRTWKLSNGHSDRNQSFIFRKN